jgi:von Willebrand factor A domain-containing protein 7
MVQLPAWAFMPNTHVEITTEAMSSINHEINYQNLRFSERAIKEVNVANVHSDDLAYQLNPSYHFDNEDFIGASSRLIDLKKKIIYNISLDNPVGSQARSNLGGALHTVQDFYAHSNWIELGNRDINLKLGRDSFIGAIESDVTCPADPGTLGAAGLSQLTSGYFLFNKGLCSVPSGKCRHGVSLLGCPNGLNKDDSSRIGFSAARTLAVKASVDFIHQVLDDPKINNNVAGVKALLGID